MRILARILIVDSHFSMDPREDPQQSPPRSEGILFKIRNDPSQDQKGSFPRLEGIVSQMKKDLFKLKTNLFS
jgi:hypothetical protein